jgi:hypothetical protein
MRYNPLLSDVPEIAACLVRDCRTAMIETDSDRVHVVAHSLGASIDSRPETTMDSTLFDRLCDELGYEPSTVRVIRVTAREVSVTYTEPSGMPAGSTQPLQQEVDEAA